MKNIFLLSSLILFTLFSCSKKQLLEPETSPLMSQLDISKDLKKDSSKCSKDSAKIHKRLIGTWTAEYYLDSTNTRLNIFPIANPTEPNTVVISEDTLIGYAAPSYGGFVIENGSYFVRNCGNQIETFNQISNGQGFTFDLLVSKPNYLELLAVIGQPVFPTPTKVRVRLNRIN